MIGRRDFVACGITCGLLAAVTHVSAGAGGVFDAVAGSRWHSGLRFIADQRSEIALAAAHTAARRGATVDLLGDDITALYQRLDLTLRSSPVATAGVTSGNALFVLERLAWERGLRTVFRGHHETGVETGVDGNSRHTLHRPGVLSDESNRRLPDGWPATLDAALANAQGRSVDLVSSGLFVPHEGEAAVLYSWLMVPGAHLRRTGS